MKPKITRKQLVAVLNLVKELDEFHRSLVGTITNIVTFIHHSAKNAIFIRYEKRVPVNGEVEYEYKVARIDPEGGITFIDKEFTTMFVRYAFLEECENFDIKNPDEYEQID